MDVTMAPFIALSIMNAEDRAAGSGSTAYKAYFINTTIYTKYKSNVDTILTTDGYSQCIVTA